MFSRAAAREKVSILGRIAGQSRGLSVRRILRLHETLLFMRAYPDNGAVLSAVEILMDRFPELVRATTGGDSQAPALVNSGLPETTNAYAYSYAVLQRLVRLYPGCLDIDWEEFSNDVQLVDTLNLAISPAETRGLEDEFSTLREWLQLAKPGPDDTDLEVVLQLLEQSPLSAREQMHVFETCEVPVLYRLSTRGSARGERVVEHAGTDFRNRPISRRRFPLRSRIERPLPGYLRMPADAARRLLDAALSTLCSRNLEIHPLIYANAADVTQVAAERGLSIVIAGVLPEFQAALETDLFFLIVKNGVPIAYGPAVVFAGACEMGINLFPEFRGGEIRFIYAEFMRCLYHLAGVRYFFLTSYGMGDGNPEALKSGAFWFYRKLGFRAANPDVEALARSEERRMKRTPGYRSSMAMLRELSYTDAVFDLSRGSHRAIDFETVGAMVTRDITARFHGDRARAARSATREALAMLRIDDFDGWSAAEKRTLTACAPVLALLPDLAKWPAADCASLARLIRDRVASGELEYARRTSQHARLRRALETAISMQGRRAAAGSR